MNKKSVLIYCSLIIFCFTQFGACTDKKGTGNTKNNVAVTDSLNSNEGENVKQNNPEKSEKQEKENLFDNPNKLVSILSETGIGELKGWQNPSDAGWGSMSEDFEVGKQKNAHGFKNSIGYLIEGSETQAKKLGIYLYVFNPSEKQHALTFLSDVTDKTFKSLGLEMSKEVRNSILDSKKLRIEVSGYILTIDLEKRKIETWIVSMERK